MDLQEAIRKRRSVNQYLPIKVEPEKIQRMLELAILAPSAGNLQSWNFVIVTDEKKRNELAQACLEQWWMNSAPVHIVVCAPTQKLKQFYGQRGIDVYSHQNCSAAIENLILTATDLGLCSCWVGALNERLVRRAIGAPEDVLMIAIITVGYAQAKLPAQSRNPLEFWCFAEEWGAKYTDDNFVFGRYGAVLQEKIGKAKTSIKEKMGLQSA